MISSDHEAIIYPSTDVSLVPDISTDIKDPANRTCNWHTNLSNPTDLTSNILTYPPSPALSKMSREPEPMDYFFPSRYSITYKRTWKRRSSTPTETIKTKTTHRSDRGHPNKHSVLYVPESYSTSYSYSIPSNTAGASSSTPPPLINTRYLPYPNYANPNPNFNPRPPLPSTMRLYQMHPPTSLNFPSIQRPLLTHSQSLTITPTKPLIPNIDANIEDVAPLRRASLSEDPEPSIPMLLSNIFFILHSLVPPTALELRQEHLPSLITQTSSLLSPNAEPTARQLSDILSNLYQLYNATIPILVRTPSVNLELDRLMDLVGRLKGALRERSYWSWECYYCLDFAEAEGVEGVRKRMVGLLGNWEVGVKRGRIPGGWCW